MSEEPLRMSDDPEFERAFGVPLDPLDVLHRDYDLAGIKARAFSGAPVATPRAPLRWLAGGGGAAAALLAALLGGWWTLGVPSPAPPDHQESAAVAPDRVLPLPTPPIAVVPPAAEPRPVNAPLEEARRPAPRPPLEPRPALVPPAQLVVVAPAEALVGADGPNGMTFLQAENAEFDRAAQRAEEDEPADALRLFEGYVAHWPQGRLVDEADLGRLDALRSLARWDEVEHLAAGLAARGSLVEKQPFLFGVRAEALAALGRCGEAVDVAGRVSREQASATRRSCPAAR